jgi:dTDP-4-dehydrorhamnose 3,5-epimerase
MSDFKATPDTDSPLNLDDFKPDTPFQLAPAHPIADLDMIDGVTLTPLIPRADGRGALIELMTTRDNIIEPIVHVYLVEAKAGSVRAWVYHRRQYDRLAYTQGSFQVVLYDIRRESPTFKKLSVLCIGKERPVLLRIPPYVVHGVKNIGDEDSTFINMPTNIYDPQNPDKSRIAANDPRIPFSFND